MDLQFNVPFTISGTSLLVPLNACLKFPHSHLAKLAKEYVQQSKQPPNMIYQLDAFQALIHYLQIGVLTISDDLTIGSVRQVFQDLGIPFPRTYQAQEVLPATHSTMATATSPPPYDSPTNSSFRSSAYTTTTNVNDLAKAPSSPLRAPTPPHLSMQDILANAVHDRLTMLLLQHLLPLVRSQAHSGIYRAAFVLVPSDIIPLSINHEHSQRQSIYLPSSDYTPVESVISLIKTPITDFGYFKIVRLQGEENNASFLTQQPVIEELKKQLRTNLNPNTLQAVQSPPPPEVKSRSERWRWTRSSSKPTNPVAVKQTGVGVEVNVEEVSIRRETNFGLFETVTGDAVVVQVFIGQS